MRTRRGSVRPRQTRRRPMSERYSKADFLRAFQLGIDIGQAGAARDPAKEYARGYSDGLRDGMYLAEGEK